MKLPENKFACIVFWPLAVWIFIGGIQNLSLMSKLDESGITTVAEVIGHKKNSWGNKIPTFRYEVLGTQYTVTTGALKGRNRQPRLGAKIDVRVNRDNPREFLKLSGGGTKEKSFAFVFIMIFLIVLPWFAHLMKNDTE